MFDRAWLPTLAIDQTCGRKLGNGPAVNEQAPVPIGFPKSIDAEMVWTGAKFQARPDLYRVELNEQHVKELENAAAEVEGNSPDLPAPFSISLKTNVPSSPRSIRRTDLSRDFPSSHSWVRPQWFGPRNRKRAWLLRSSGPGPRALFEVQERCALCWDRVLHWEPIWSPR